MKKSQAVGVFQILPRIELLIYIHVCACISTAAELEVEFFKINFYWTGGNIYPVGKHQFKYSFQFPILIKVHIISLCPCASHHFILNYADSLQNLVEDSEFLPEINEKLKFLMKDILVRV